MNDSLSQIPALPVSAAPIFPKLRRTSCMSSAVPPKRRGALKSLSSTGLPRVPNNPNIGNNTDLRQLRRIPSIGCNIPLIYQKPQCLAVPTFLKYTGLPVSAVPISLSIQGLPVVCGAGLLKIRRAPSIGSTDILKIQRTPSIDSTDLPKWLNTPYYCRQGRHSEK